MSSRTRSLISGLAVAACALAVVGGSRVRSRVEEGGPLYAQFTHPAETAGLVASQSDEFPEGAYFRDMVQLLKREFVEPVADEQKLATGGVKGMISSLGDPKSQFYEPEAFEALLNARDGMYEGIGAALAFSWSRQESASATGTPDSAPSELGQDQTFPIAHLRVMAVTPGGPAEKAGLKPGDIIREVDGKWLPDPVKVARFSALTRRLSSPDFAKLKPKEAEELNKQYRELGSELRPLAERAIMPGKARDKLVLGAGESVEVVWAREGKEQQATLEKQPSEMPSLKVLEDGSILLPVREESVEPLLQAISGKKEVVIDLRSNPLGEYEAIRPLISALAPAGRYGTIDSEKKGKDIPLEVEVGNASAPKITLKVDETTGGPAEILALALSSKGVAKLSGRKMAGDLSFVETIRLPDGSGYTLTRGVYTTSNTVEEKSAAKKAAMSTKSGGDA